MRRTRSVRLLAVLLTAGLVLAACSGDEEPQAEPTPTEEVTPEPEPEPEFWPLTGLEVTDGDPAAHPPLIVKIDNTAAAAPQVGLSGADIVVEQMVEGGLTRLAVMFHSELPTEVGPVRSLRATDIGIAKPVGGILVASGGAHETLDRLRRAQVPLIEEGANGITRSSSRRATYNVLADLAVIADDVVAGSGTRLPYDGGRPDDYLPWGEAADLPEGEVATQLQVRYPSQNTRWEFTDDGYVNTNSHAAEGDRFVADTVLVVRVEVIDAGYTDAAGNRVPELRFEGTGEAQLFHDGQMVKGRWSKETVASALTLRSGGADLVVPAGRTWIHLLPVNNASVLHE
ncbi:DUF3048 domain-containing protein [Nocardioides limicola]|uniref:DUF3048 domain-containing protein n=1 Tax=Nocardioides limicola TaxID=2803368 RepID=UPI00193BC116|nr:DUF3048 domain-containing protein [Nocardioides sp. DJM-14]